MPSFVNPQEKAIFVGDQSWPYIVNNEGGRVLNTGYYEMKVKNVKVVNFFDGGIEIVDRPFLKKEPERTVADIFHKTLGERLKSSLPDSRGLRFFPMGTELTIQGTVKNGEWGVMRLSPDEHAQYSCHWAFVPNILNGKLVLSPVGS